jgi:hypothetical protein
LSPTPYPEVTRALFSATLPETVEQLARSVMTQPMRLTVGERNAASGTIAQKLVFCGQERGKLLALRQLISEGIKPPIIVFVQSKVRKGAGPFDFFSHISFFAMKYLQRFCDEIPSARIKWTRFVLLCVYGQ